MSNLIYSPSYNTDLGLYGIDKPFALDRGQMVLDQLSREQLFSASYEEPGPITREDMLLVHTAEYLERLTDPATWMEIFEFKADEYFPEKAVKPLPHLIGDISIKCGGTLLAARRALQHGLAANLGGGYHHAFPDCGRGYCVLHDIAIAVKRLQNEEKVEKVLIVDLDFHQGDGTAVVFGGDPSVFTLSVHSQEGWPEEKQQSCLDVPVYQGEEHLYLEKTKAALDQALRQVAPDMVLYVAGSDPYEKDILPGTVYLKLTLDQMRARDYLVIDTFADLGIPLASVFAGGYGPHVWEIHYWATRRLLERSGAPVGSTSIGR